jgi:hypothetical protein
MFAKLQRSGTVSHLNGVLRVGVRVPRRPSRWRTPRRRRAAWRGAGGRPCAWPARRMVAQGAAGDRPCIAPPGWQGSCVCAEAAVCAAVG